MKLENHPVQEQVLLVESYVWALVVLIVTVILAGIVFFMLYSVTFVTQPIKSMAPIDQGYLKMLNDIVLLIVGGIGAVMGKKAVGSAAKVFGGQQSMQPMGQPMCQPMQGYGQYGYSNNHGFNPTTNGIPNQPFGAMPKWTNPELDESWTPGPPPTTPPDHLEDDHEREQLAIARRETD